MAKLKSVLSIVSVVMIGGLGLVCSPSAHGASSSVVGPMGSVPSQIVTSNHWTLSANYQFLGTSLAQDVWTPNWFGPTSSAITPGISIPYDQNCFSPSNVSVAGGALMLTAVKQQCQTWNGLTFNYASGNIRSTSRNAYTFGYFEAKIWFPVTNCERALKASAGRYCIANHPAFWLDSAGTNIPTNNTSEVDIAEGLRGRLCELVHFTSPSSPTSSLEHCSISGLSQWHTYGFAWDSTQAKFFLDGKLQYVVPLPLGFNIPMSVFIDYSVPSHWAPTVPSTMKVGYVRVWSTQ
jgi:beta-glucanase (GH16 family)